jgi:hypothetical protein
LGLILGGRIVVDDEKSARETCEEKTHKKLGCSGFSPDEKAKNGVRQNLDFDRKTPQELRWAGGPY